MSENFSGREIAARNLIKFKEWVAERMAANDWPDYIRGDKLNRSELALECGFALSVVRQNPAIKESLKALEDHLRSSGIMPTATTPHNTSLDENTSIQVDNAPSGNVALLSASLRICNGKATPAYTTACSAS